MLHLLIGKDWTANREVIMSRIAKDVAQRRSGRILIVPELISHDTERRLCRAAGDTSSRYAEVLSFTRLVSRVSEFMGCAMEECLDEGGRIVAMAASARMLSSKLKAYASVETKPEFLSGLVDGMDEFKRCCISSRDLLMASEETEGSLAQKLEEPSLLMEGYDALCSRGKRDPRDQMSWLLDILKDGTFGEDHVFYIDGFPDFTRQHMAVLEHLIATSPQVTVSINCDRPDSDRLAFEKAGKTAADLIRCAQKAGVQVHIEKIPDMPAALSCVRDNLFQGAISQGIASGALKAFHGENVWMECMSAAEEIGRLVRGGARYRDIVLACTDMAAYGTIAEFVFHRMNIPLYQSGTEDILKKSVISVVMSALDAALNGFAQKDVIRYLRSVLSPLTLDECDLVENYAILWGIRGSRWTEEWKHHPDGLGMTWDEAAAARIEKLEVLRSSFISPLVSLKEGFHNASMLRQQVEALYAFLEEINMESKLEQLAQTLDVSGDNREAQILNQLWEILMGALEQLYDVLGDTHWESQHFVRLLRLLLSQYNVGTIPPVLDAVQMGPVSSMRCHEQKHLILLGAQEGNLPGYPGSKGVLTDQERVMLRQLGVP